MFPDVVVVADFNKNISGLVDLAKKRLGLADLRAPIHPPSSINRLYLPFACL